MNVISDTHHDIAEEIDSTPYAGTGAGRLRHTHGAATGASHPERRHVGDITVPGTFDAVAWPHACAAASGAVLLLRVFAAAQPAVRAVSSRLCPAAFFARQVQVKASA